MFCLGHLALYRKSLTQRPAPVRGRGAGHPEKFRRIASRQRGICQPAVDVFVWFGGRFVFCCDCKFSRVPMHGNMPPWRDQVRQAARHVWKHMASDSTVLIHGSE